jgi:CYTH domain-containing protein
LSIAEIELESRDQQVAIPNWVGEEVTGLPQYKNYTLALRNEEAWKNSLKESNQ